MNCQLHFKLKIYFFIVIPCFAALCHAMVYEHADDLPSSTLWDFIIIGGGTAGSVLANRLTEDLITSVLVLEAGVNNIGAVPTQIPFLCTMPHSEYDWNFTTTVQEGLSGREIAYPRGYILGGSSSVNGLFYTRGSQDDFNRLASVTGDSGWSWNNVQTYFRRNEKWTLPADHHNTTGQYNPAIHSLTGINSVSLAGWPQSINENIIRASAELGGEFAFNLDMNSGVPLGLGWLQATIKGGNRSSAATSYLGPEFIDRPNLHVLVNTRVTRVLQSNSLSSNVGHLDGPGPLLTTVEYAYSANGPRFQATASKELLLSAGTIGTPQILMNSGIGNSTYLSSMGIPPTGIIVDLPSVGQNFSDHPRLVNNWAVNGTHTFDPLYQNATLLNELEEAWSQTGKGPLVDTFVSHLLFVRLNESVLERLGIDPAAGNSTAHYELGFSNGNIVAAPTGHFIGITTRVVSPLSRGSILLNTTDPFTAPLINPAFFSDSIGFDLTTMREAIKTAARFLNAPAWKGYVVGNPGVQYPGTNISSSSTSENTSEATDLDKQLDAYIQISTGTSAHAVGTAAMSLPESDYGVVEPNLTVKGVQGLRVVDASVFPFVPSGHTQAPTYVIAERASEMIKEFWGLE